MLQTLQEHCSDKTNNHAMGLIVMWHIMPLVSGIKERCEQKRIQKLSKCQILRC